MTKTKRAIKAKAVEAEVVDVGSLDTTEDIEVVGFVKAEGSSIRDADVEKVGLELQALANKLGSILPDDVITAASKKKSAMHSYFTWDDADAAHKRRQDEARYVIRSIKAKVVRVNIRSTGGESRKVSVVRFLHSTKSKDARKAYRTIDSVLLNEDHKSTVTYEMYRYLMGAFGKFNGFTELIEELDQLEPLVISLAKRLEIKPAEVRKQINKVRTG